MRVDAELEGRLEAGVGGEAGELVVRVHDLLLSLDEVGVHTTLGLRGRAELLQVRGLREEVRERTSASGPQVLAVDRGVVEGAGDR